MKKLGSPNKNILMEITQNKVVTLTYKLSIGDEEEGIDTIEIVDEEEPMVFIQGLSGLPEGFEKNVEGLSDGNEFNFTVNAEDGYGEIDDEAFIDLPLDLFKIENGELPEGMLEVGNFIPMTNDEGHKLTGRVIEVTDSTVYLDFNHPLAGKNMHFEGKILAVRDATKSEIEHGHVHGEGGHHH